MKNTADQPTTAVEHDESVREIPIIWKGQPSKVVIKKMTFGAKNKVQDMATTIRMVGRIPQLTISQKILKEQSILNSIVSAPFQVSIPAIEDLDADIGERLWNEVNELNNLDPEKKKSSLGPSGVGQTTQKPPEK